MTLSPVVHRTPTDSGPAACHGFTSRDYRVAHLAFTTWFFAFHSSHRSKLLVIYNLPKKLNHHPRTPGSFSDNQLWKSETRSLSPLEKATCVAHIAYGTTSDPLSPLPQMTWAFFVKGTNQTKMSCVDNYSRKTANAIGYVGHLLKNPNSHSLSVK